MSEDLERELRILGDYDDETIYQMPVGEIMSLVDFDPDVPGTNVT